MKAPAFQFYADDFIGGTVAMTAEEVGAYMRLLCYQWGQGAIPTRQDQVDRIAGCSVGPDVLAKFPNGKNERLEAEREKQRLYREQQSNKGKASAQARFNRGSTVVQPSGQPNGNSPSPSPSPSPISNSSLLPTKKTHPPQAAKRMQIPAWDEVAAFFDDLKLPRTDAEWFFHKCEGNGWTNGGKPMKNWAAVVRSWRAAQYLPSQKPVNGVHRTSRPKGFEDWKSDPKPGDDPNPPWGTQAYVRKHGHGI